jgi:hypothetical protein
VSAAQTLTKAARAEDKALWASLPMVAESAGGRPEGWFLHRDPKTGVEVSFPREPEVTSSIIKGLKISVASATDGALSMSYTGGRMSLGRGELTDDFHVGSDRGVLNTMIGLGYAPTGHPEFTLTYEGMTGRQIWFSSDDFDFVKRTLVRGAIGVTLVAYGTGIRDDPRIPAFMRTLQPLSAKAGS